MANMRAARRGDFMFATIKDLFTKANADKRVKTNDNLSGLVHTLLVQVDPLSLAFCNVYTCYIINTLVMSVPLSLQPICKLAACCMQMTSS